MGLCEKGAWLADTFDSHLWNPDTKEWVKSKKKQEEEQKKEEEEEKKKKEEEEKKKKTETVL